MGNLLIVLAEIMEVVIGAKITGYMHLRYSKKLLMRSWQNMRNEEADEKWFYVFMLSLMVVFGIMGCESKDNGSQDTDKSMPIHITIPKRRRSNFTEEIDTVSVIEENGEILYECDTDGEIVLKLNDGVLTVTVPTINDSCFEN